MTNRTAFSGKEDNPAPERYNQFLGHFLTGNSVPFSGNFILETLPEMFVPFVPVSKFAEFLAEWKVPSFAYTIRKESNDAIPEACISAIYQVNNHGFSRLTVPIITVMER